MPSLLLQPMNRQEDDPPWAEFGRRFKELVAGEDQVAVARRLHYTQGRVSQMMRGEKPSPDFVERLVRAYSLDRAEWFGLAGLPDPEAAQREGEERATRMVLQILREQNLLREEEEPWNPAQAFVDGLTALEAEFGRPVLVSTQEYVQDASPEAIERILGKIRADLEREEASRRGGGSPGGAMLLAGR